MGLYKHNGDGNLQIISGRGKAEYGASTIRKGTYSFANVSAGVGWRYTTVTFDSPMVDTDYEIILTPSVGATSTQSISTTYTIDNKTTNGFRISYYDNATTTNVGGNYTAFKLYTDNEYNGLLNNQRYSTDEIDTGKTWIDGKKIYRKVFTIDTQTRIEGSRDLGEIPNADLLVYAAGIGDDRTSSSTGTRMALNNAVFYIDASNHFVISSFTGTFQKFRFIAEYTKTT